MQTNRDQQLLQLRPSIPSTDDPSFSSDAEIFQNNTLWPILKWQNELLIYVFKQYFEKRKGVFYELKTPKKRAYIEQFVQKDLRFRNLLTGLIMGHFTEEELWLYFENEKEYSRRIATMLVKRMQDQVGVL